MEEKKLEYSRPEHKLKLFTMGLNLEVQPYWLLKQMVNENSQNILDKLIFDKFEQAIRAFDDWEKDVINNIKGDEGELLFDEHKYNKHIQQIQDVADISRHLLPLHTDSEYELRENPLLQDIVQRAYTYWGYNKFYGHER